MAASSSNSGKRTRPPVPPRHDRAQPAAGEAAGDNQEAATPNRAALFSAINSGEDITSGLRKVNKSDMTHKNPELRGSSIVPATSAVSK